MGWTLGFGFFVGCNAIRETRRVGRLNAYIFLVWGEFFAYVPIALPNRGEFSQPDSCLAQSLLAYLYLQKVIEPSFVYFFGIVLCVNIAMISFL
jgi:hypothetical protein